MNLKLTNNHLCKNTLHSCCVVILLLFFKTAAFAQQSLDYFILKIDSLEQLNDHKTITAVYHQGSQWAEAKALSEEDHSYLEFKLNRSRHLLRFSEIAVDSAIASYHSVYNSAQLAENYLIETKALGFLANAYRSKRELGKAFEYNQKEIEAALKSEDKLLYGRALITELDIAYNSLPSPMDPADLQDLITKGNFVIDYSEKNELYSILPFGKLYVSKFYIKQNEFAKAEDILYSISEDEPLSVTFSKYEHLCEIAQKKPNLPDYRKYTLEFKKRAYQTKRTFVALNAHNYLLDYSLKVKDEDSASFYAKALEQNLSEVDTTKYLDFLDVSYATLANYYKGKNPEKELQYLSYSTQINRIITARQKEAFSAILKYKNEVSQLESKNSDLAKANAFIRNNLFALIVILLALSVLAVIIFQKYKKSRRKAESVLIEKQHLEDTVNKKFIELHNKQRILLEELKYIKADRNYVEFHTSEKRFVDRNVLTNVLGELPPNFIQVHRSYIVNRNFIKSSTHSFILLNGEIEIPLSRTYKSRLADSL
ncbi:MAG: LytTR family transcriptional regulator [Flavobacteriaceae bacterium]|nr:LytTR family transcriptional regulator [Flavobacteriaceae bacterium]